ncbi:hypothetical protein F2P79_025970 [Pimephales promelas]|nr:hypothetical protein F2P79_025970 [Pimephales promelas]
MIYVTASSIPVLPVMAAPVIPATGTPEIPVLVTRSALMMTISATTVSKLLVISVWSTLSQKFPSLAPHSQLINLATAGPEVCVTGW